MPFVTLVRSFIMGALVLALGGCAAETVDESVASEAEDLRVDCSAVRCAIPLCAEGQHLAQRGSSCCPVCVGPSSESDRCAAVLCPMIKCADGYESVVPPGRCCGTCRPIAPVAECSTDLDCPQFQCIACPCPTSECHGRECITTTPDESTCGGV